MLTTPEIEGYVIKARRVLIDPNKITPEELASLTEEDLCISYYIGKTNRVMMKKPTDKSLMFASEVSARSHIQKHMKDATDIIMGIVPVYKMPKGKVTVIRKYKWEPPKQELLMDRKRQRAKKIDGRIPKLR